MAKTNCTIVIVCAILAGAALAGLRVLRVRRGSAGDES